ncbi:putative PEP-binding protein [Vibrio sp. 10N.261.51.F12]|uniref:putative PEP-binding protein n=1 Tax=Vibrio sp. 10N.261.51.F12 TaxID=3229679 RepID=UPI003552C5F1
MSYENEQVNNKPTASLSYGNVFPSHSDQGDAEHLYVSIAELIMEKIFFHPNYAQLEGELDTVELDAINALLGGREVADFIVSTLVAEISSAVKPEHNTIRVELNDADSYNMSALLGGKAESGEVNPILGVRGVARFASEAYKASFALECNVIKALREQGINVEIVVPCVRALSDAATIIDKLAEQGLPRGLNGLKILFACDTPSAVLLSERLLQYFDGLVLKIDNLTQLTLGVDREQDELTHLYDPQNEAVLKLVRDGILTAKDVKKPALVVIGSLEDYPVLRNHLEELGHAEVYVTA